MLLLLPEQNLLLLQMCIRDRVYIVGYFDFRCAGKVLPEPETNGAALVQVRAGSQGKRVYSPRGLSCTLTSQAGGMGGKTGLYDVGVPIKENTKLGNKIAREGDSIDLGYANFNSRRGRVGHQIDVYKRQDGSCMVLILLSGRSHITG